MRPHLPEENAPVAPAVLTVASESGRFLLCASGSAIQKRPFKTVIELMAIGQIWDIRDHGALITKCRAFIMDYVVLITSANGRD